MFSQHAHSDARILDRLQLRTRLGGQLPWHMPQWMAKSGQSQWAHPTSSGSSSWTKHRHSLRANRKLFERAAFGHRNAVDKCQDNLEGCGGTWLLPALTSCWVPQWWWSCQFHPSPQGRWWVESWLPPWSISCPLPTSPGQWTPPAFPDFHPGQKAALLEIPCRCTATSWGEIWWGAGVDYWLKPFFAAAALQLSAIGCWQKDSRNMRTWVVIQNPCSHNCPYFIKICTDHLSQFHLFQGAFHGTAPQPKSKVPMPCCGGCLIGPPTAALHSCRRPTKSWLRSRVLQRDWKAKHNILGAFLSADFCSDDIFVG